MDWWQRIKCVFGFHEFREFLFSRDPKIYEQRCIHCGYSPTWDE